MSADSQAQFDTSPSPTTIRGRWTVVAMVSFGVLTVLTMWVYWEMYTRPFRPLQQAIADRFPGSSPRAVGGRHKSHKPGSPRTLRIIVQVPREEFDPETDEAASRRRALEVARLAEEHGDLSRYDELEIHLMQQAPESSIRHWSQTESIPDWREQLAHPQKETEATHSSPSS